jgi:hypothetical protein
VNVPPNSKVVFKSPVNGPVPLPPALKVRLPLWTATLPLLKKGIWKPAPASAEAPVTVP